MSVWFHVNKAYVEALAKAKLSTFDEWMNAGVDRERYSGRKESLAILSREVLGFRVFLKRYRPTRPTMRFFLRSSRQRREAENAMRLREAGIPTAEVVAAGEERIGGRVGAAFVATREIENVRPLSDLIRTDWPDVPRVARPRLIDALASLVRRMHEAGFVDYDLHPRNVLVRRREGAEPELFILDSPRGRWDGPGIRRRQRRDLACLEAGTRGFVSRTDRMRFYLRYHGRRRLTHQNHSTLRAILERADRLDEGADMVEIETATTDAAGVRTVMFVRKDCHDVLVRNGFETFDDFLDPARGEVINRHEIRDVAVLELDTDRGPRTVFLKRFGPMLRKDALRDLLRLRRVRTKARVEARMIEAFRRRGFSVPDVLAWGERHVMGRDRASFLMVEKLPEGRAIEDLLSEVRDPHRRRRIILAAADFVRRMHDSGLTHKDLYGKHVFIDERDDGTCGIATIDLQRAAVRRKVGPRHRGRNLASLMVSIPPETVTWRERRAFLLRYLRVEKLDRDALRFVREFIMPRARKLSRRRVYRAWMPILGVSL